MKAVINACIIFLMIFSVKSLDLAAVRQELLKKSNEYRKQHCADELTMDDSQLESVAQAYAEKLANQIQDLVHNDNRQSEYGQKCGENLFWSSVTNPTTDNATKAVDDWYKEKDNYDFSKGTNKDGNSGMIGHFTQLVWKGSQKVGFGIAASEAGTYVVADYYPPGNYKNNYVGNVTDGSECSDKGRYLEVALIGLIFTIVLIL